MRRRSAKKSRYGCKECKRRHVKCDEAKPVCSDCRIRHLHCSYVSTSTITPASQRGISLTDHSNVSSHDRENDADRGQSLLLPPTPLTAPRSNQDPISASSSPLSQGHLNHDSCKYSNDLDDENNNAPGLSPHPPFNPASTDQTFKLHDLELFHNFKANVWDVLSADEVPAAQRFTEVIVEHSFARPYLMDQLLALSAAHMSTQRPHQASFYRQEATRRQTQALALFNTSPTAKATDECLPAFFFSILLSYQVLFDALDSREDFSAFLDKLTKGFRLCGGVRAMAGNSLDSLVMQYRQQIGSDLLDMERLWTSPDTGFGAVFSDKLARLKCLIEEADVNHAISKPCSAALNLLCTLPTVDTARASSGFKVIRVLRWVVTVRPEFIELIEQRRPEALIIIAHFGVILHDAKDCWVFGDAGAYIIRSITAFLGSYWAEWLTWPNEVLGGVDYLV
ncbi:hypothetical protein F4678DRAFT_322609 [Xylaria arbuscula]|nr:hypothetical protein F4678DRAFT_322609 [Xylaria arbuscula]